MTQSLKITERLITGGKLHQKTYFLVMKMTAWCPVTWPDQANSLRNIVLALGITSHGRGRRRFSPVSNSARNQGELSVKWGLIISLISSLGMWQTVARAYLHLDMGPLLQVLVSLCQHLNYPLEAATFTADSQALPQPTVWSEDHPSSLTLLCLLSPVPSREVYSSPDQKPILSDRKDSFPL